MTRRTSGPRRAALAAPVRSHTHHDLRSRLHCGALSVVGVLAIAGCDPAPATDVAGAAERIDLTRHGVHEIVAVDGGYDLLDADGLAVGRVALHDDGAAGQLDVSLHARTAEVDWTDAEAAMRCDGGAPTTISAGEHGWADAQQTAGDDLKACDDALLVGFEVARAAGLTAPWDYEAANDVSFRNCQTISTWVGGSSCSSCASAAALDRGPGWTWSGGSCDSGTIYTTCSHTYCASQLLNE
jgi:hypothetical protein